MFSSMMYNAIKKRWKMTSTLSDSRQLNQKFEAVAHDKKTAVIAEPQTQFMVSQEVKRIMGPLSTPTKGSEAAGGEPWTPTSNLKMLISAASPEIRNREKEKTVSEETENSSQ
ncbi:transcription factor E2F8 isoform X1, partial [Tachysurus ichikawai]